jgi:hypothetical protein
MAVYDHAKNFKNHKLKSRNVLKRMTNYLHTDCDRDFRLAQNWALGKHVGSF